MAMPYRTWDRMAPDDRAALTAQAQDFLSKLE
jgi:deoxyribodipyrimidine photolyase-like uncharacterized protein